MNGKQLKNSILQWAIQGKLVPQDPNDEPASVLLERIRAEKARLVKEGKIKKDKNESIIFRGDDNSHYEKFLATGEVKCIDDEIPFEIPQGWEWVRLNDLITNATGLSYQKELLDHKTHDMIRVLRGGNIEDGAWLKKDDDIMISSEYVRPELLLKKGTFITPAVTSLEQMGKTGLVLSDEDKTVVGGFVLMLSPILKDEGLISYLFIVFQTEYYKSYCKQITKKSGQAFYNLSRPLLMQFLVPIPSRESMNGIIREVDKVRPFVSKYSVAQSELETLNITLRARLRKSILQEAIQGRLVPQDPTDEPASVLLERIQEEKLRLLKEGKLKKKDITDSVIFKGDDNKYYERINGNLLDISDEVPFDLPDSWAWARLSTVCNMYTGNSISEKDKSTYYTGVSGMQYIGTKDVKFDNSIDYMNGIAIPDKFLPNFKIASAGSVLMCVEGGSAGRKFGQTDRDVCFGNKLCCFSSFGCNQRYLYYYIQSPSFFESFQKNKTGIIGGVSVNSLKNLLIAIPPLKEQVRIAQHVAETLSCL